MLKGRFLLIILIVILTVIFCSNINYAKSKDLKGWIKHNGRIRSYLVHIPSSLWDSSPNRLKPISLVLAFHGGGGTAKGMKKLTEYGFDVLADKENFIVVYPNGIRRHWNDGRIEANDFSHRKKIDDVGFISQLINRMIRKWNVDHKRVYVTGISNGAGMSFRLACELSNKIAAAAPVALCMPENLVGSSPRHPVSILMLMGTEDPLVPWDGGSVGGKLFRGRGKVISAFDSIRYWANLNNCSKTPVVKKLPNRDPSDETIIISHSYSNGENNSESILYEIRGGGHTWPDGLQYFGEWLIGKTTHDINGNRVIWNFFKKHPKK